MRLLFAIKEPYLPESIGGGLLSMHHMALQLLHYGHGCEVVSKSGPSVRQFADRFLRRISCRRWTGTIEDQKNGYVTHRAIISSLVPELLRKRLAAFRPNVVMTQGQGFVELAVEAIKLGYPVILRLNTADSVASLKQSVNDKAELEGLLRRPHAVLASGSQFIATRVRELLDLESTVIHSVIRFNDFKVSERAAEFITFVNPCKLKGLEIALKVAALLPHRKFLFVESWPLSWVDRQELNTQLKSVPNVQFRPRSLHMKDVYQRTSVLLMPAQWEETFGRVIVEAGLNGIPSLASNIGGIPEAIGDGGILLPPSDPPESWAATLERILSDKDLYARLSANAVLSAARPELNPDEITRHLLETARSLNRTPIINDLNLCFSDDIGPPVMYAKEVLKSIPLLRAAVRTARRILP